MDHADALDESTGPSVVAALSASTGRHRLTYLKKWVNLVIACVSREVTKALSDT
jgi:hypothetical protein